jgi:hypothetical protein
MRRTTLSTTLALVCFFFLCADQAQARPSHAGSEREPPARAQSSEGTVYYCVSSWANSVVYFSEPFETSELVRDNIQQSYFQFLKQRYSYPNDATNVICSISQTLATAKSDRDGDEASVKRANHSVTETGWTYRGRVTAASAARPAQAAPPAPTQTVSAPTRAPVPKAVGAAAPAPTASGPQRPAAAPASVQMYYTLCRYQGQRDAHPIIYVTPIIHTDAAAGTITQAFYTYMTTTYDLSKVQYGSGYCETVSSSADQQAYTMSQLEKQWASSKTEVTHIDWTDAPAEVAATNAKVASARATAAVPTAAANQNYVVCASERDGPVIYFSEIFAAAMPPAPPGSTRGNGGAQRAAVGAFQTPFLAFLQKKYAYKSGSNYPVECGVSFPPNAGGLEAAQNYKQSLEDLAKQGKKPIVETGWTNNAP